MSLVKPINKVRATIFFKDAAFSWTETYWSVRTTLQDARNDLTGLLAVRLPLLADAIEVPYVRLSVDNVARDSRILTPTDVLAVEVASGRASPEEPPERPYSTVKIRVEMGDRYRKIMYMSGIPDEVITDPIGPTFSPIYAAAFFRFKTYLSSPQALWGTKVRIAGEAPVVHQPILDAKRDPANGKLTIYAAASVAGLAVGGTAVVSALSFDRTGALPNPRPNGLFRVTALLDGGTTIVLTNVGNFTYTGGGFIENGVWDFKESTNVIVVGETHRKRGVRSLQPLGRRPTRR